MKINKFPNSEELVQELAKKIIADILDAIKNEDKALLLVSGGSTPIKLFETLSKEYIPWEKVTIGLIDERFVAPDHEKSNALLVKTHFLHFFAEKANFIGMVYDTNSESENLKRVKEAYKPFINSRSTISILGMGDDGHTASLFPNDKSSEDDLAGNAEGNIINTIAPVFPHKRITCNKNLILNSSSLYLMFTGESKLNVYKKAESEKLPISFFKHKIQTYYSK